MKVFATAPTIANVPTQRVMIAIGSGSRCVWLITESGYLSGIIPRTSYHSLAYSLAGVHKRIGLDLPPQQSCKIEGKATCAGGYRITFLLVLLWAFRDSDPAASHCDDRSI